MKTEQPVIRIPLEGTSPPGLFLLRLDFPLSEDKLAGFYRDCSAQRRERSRAYRRPEDRARCLAAGWLLARAARRLGPGVIREARDGKGKPYLPDFTGTYISLTHSGPWVACAIHDRPVGVDIERVRPADAGLAGAFMSPRELELYAGSPEADRPAFLCRTWTAKEAYLKAVGSGFSLAPGGITLEMYGSGLRVRPEDGHSGPWGFYGSVLDDGSRLALCWRRGDQSGSTGGTTYGI